MGQSERFYICNRSESEQGLLKLMIRTKIQCVFEGLPLLLILGFCLSPFTQANAYPFGVMPSGANTADAVTAYDNFKTSYFATDCSGTEIRVRNNPGSNTTVSEGMGYGMLMAAYLEPDATGVSVVQGLLNFVNANVDSHGLMNWQVTCGGPTSGGSNGATDGDEDIALGLVEANSRWPGNGFGAAATLFIGRIYSYETDGCGLKPGDVFGGCGSTTDPSYFATSYFTTFQCFTGVGPWATVKSSVYNQLGYWYANYALPPDWINATTGTYSSGSYGYDACRVPWRLSLDYLWNGNTTAQNQCQKIVNNFMTVNPLPATTGDGYNYSTGAETSSNHNAAFLGPMGDGAMVNSTNQSWLNSEYLNLRALSMGSAYYQDAHKVLSLMVQTGLFTDPCSTGPTPTPTKTATTTPSGTPTNTGTPSSTRSPTGTPTVTATETATTTPTNTTTFSPTGTPTNTPSITPTPTDTFTGQPTGTPTASPTLTPTVTLTLTPTDTFTGQPTDTPTASPTATLSSTQTMTSTKTFTGQPTSTATATLSPTSTNTVQGTFTFTPTPTVPTPTADSMIVISQPYPNPNYGPVVEMDISGAGLSTIQWDVFTAAFRKIRSRKVAASTFNHLVWNLMDMEGSAVSDGLYYFRVEVDGMNGKTVTIKKVLVLR